MFEWKIEDMVLMNEDSKYEVGRKQFYKVESKVLREDKIAFVDKFQDEKLSYILSLIEKFNKDKEDLPKDKWGCVKTVSLKAWIKRNDTKYNRPIIDNNYDYGRFVILSCKRNINGAWDKAARYDYYDDLVDELFHRQLEECERKEYAYFLTHDEYSILKAKLKEKIDIYGITFGVHILWDSNGKILISDDNGNNRDITIDELKYMLSKYKELDNLVEKITKETNIVF